MPNLKLYIDETLWPARKDAVAAALPGLRDLLCQHFAVPPAACQLAALPVLALPDQPAVNAELMILPRPERTRAVVTGAAEALRDRLQAVLGRPAAVRIAHLDPVTYVALK